MGSNSLRGKYFIFQSVEDGLCTKALVHFLRAHGHGLTLKGLSAYYAELTARYARGELRAATFNKRMAGAKKRVREVLAQGNASLSAAERFRLEEALSSFKSFLKKSMRAQNPAFQSKTRPCK